MWDDGEAPARPVDGVPRSSSLLNRAERDTIEEAVIRWTKRFGACPLEDGKSFREIARWKGVSLWWFAEIYLHHTTEAARYVRLIEIFHRLIDRHQPREIEAPDLPADEALLLARTCSARGVLFDGSAMRRVRGTRLTSLRSRWNTTKTALSTVKGWFSRARPKVAFGQRKGVLFLSHAAFWRERRNAADGTSERYEHYFDRLIPGVAADDALAPHVVAVGPNVAFRQRGRTEALADWARLEAAGPFVHLNRYTSFRVFREVGRATRQCRRLWARLRESPSLRDAFRHRDVVFEDLMADGLARTLLLQLPWAVRVYEEVTEMLRDVKPAVLCLYNEAGGLGRAAVAACRAEGVPTVALQHGIIYPRYYSYTYTADETDAPRPDRTAVFGEAARRQLVADGGYDARSLVVTGSPKFDALLEGSRQWVRSALRERYGAPTSAHVVVVASRYRGIRASYQSIGSAFRGLIEAVEALPDAFCLVKPHPAEPAEGYAADLRATGVTKTRLVPAEATLAEVLHAADALVTVESLSAVEALVLARPVLILNTPTNLQEMVERGVALGVPEGADPSAALRELLFDTAVRARLEAARREYLNDVACGVDGGATRRILDLLRSAAGGGPASSMAADVIGS